MVMIKNKKIFLIILFIFFFSCCFFIIPSSFGIYKSMSSLNPTLNISKPILIINLDNQNANVQGTSKIYEKYSVGFYLDSSATNQMTPSINGIIIPKKNGYIFQGYYTQINGAGTQYIDENGKLTSAANSSNFTSEDTLYAYYVENSKTLYYVLKNAAKEGTYAETYTGLHQDSMDSTKSTETIYYWYGSDATNGTAILNKNNVIFAGHCWQMIRTTDTGGVRIIYNGEAVNNQCLNNRGYHIGYGGYSPSQNLASNYWYGTDYTYDSAKRVFSVSGTTEQVTWNATTGPDLIGKYTCKSSTESGTCSNLYLVESYDNSTNANLMGINASSNYMLFGNMLFNKGYASITDIGYMYNTKYSNNTINLLNTETLINRSTISTSYWFAHNVVWGNPIANKYNLDNPYKVSTPSDYNNLVGEYTFGNTSQTYTNTSVNYIVGILANRYYLYFSLDDYENHTLSDYNYTYTYGENYTDNGNGTYTINNPTTINRIDWMTNYSDIQNKYACKNAINNTCSELLYITATTNTSITYMNVAYNFKYAKGFTYDSNTNLYTLNDESVNFWDITDDINKTNLNNAHYTCWNTTGTCEKLSYIESVSVDGKVYYIDLTDGKSIEDAIDEMLYSDETNTTNSIIKSGVDAWYKKYILDDYDDYIDDTIYCNDRSISDLGLMNPNGGDLTVPLKFKGYIGEKDLSCPNVTDRFSVSNNKAKLTYKVGLMSAPEMNLLNDQNTRKVGQNYWVISPHSFASLNTKNFYLDYNGNLKNNIVSLNYGVRPVISLVSGLEYSEGDGSMANPYVVDLNSLSD